MKTNIDKTLDRFLKAIQDKGFYPYPLSIEEVSRAKQLATDNGVKENGV